MSLSFWPTLYLAVSLLVIWLGFRLLAGRTVLPARRFARFFVMGMVGAGFASLVAQRIMTNWADVETVSWSSGPIIEEVFKAIPVLVVVLLLIDGRRLAIGDAVMAGIATGLGFQFVEGNFGVLTTAEAGNWHETVWPLSYPFGLKGDWTYFMGHGVTAGLVGLAAVVGLRLRGRLLGLLFATVALALGTFSHIIFNWKAVTADYLFGGNSPEAVAKSSDVVEWINDVTLQGRLIFFLLGFGTIAAVWWEGRRCSRVLHDRHDLVLADEWVRPITAVEWTVALQRVPAGRRIVTGTLAFFRQRRALALALLDRSNDPPSQSYRAHLDERLAHRIEELDVPSDGRWLPPASARRAVVARFVRRTVPAIVAMVALLLLFSIALSSLGSWADRIYSTAVALVLIGLGLAFAVLRARRFLQRPHPDRATSDGDALVGYHAQAMMLGTGFLSAVFGLVALASTDAVVSGAEFVTQYGSDWVKAGGSLGALGAVGAMLAVGAPDAPDPCQGLADEAANADADLENLEAEATALYDDAVATYANAVAKGMDPAAVGRDGVVGLGVSLPSNGPRDPLTFPTDSSWLQPGAGANPVAGSNPTSGTGTGPGATGGNGGSSSRPPDDDRIFVMSDGTRLKVPIRIPPPRSFGATRSRGLPRLPTAGAPQRLVEAPPPGQGAPR